MVTGVKKRIVRETLSNFDMEYIQMKKDGMG